MNENNKDAQKYWNNGEYIFAGKEIFESIDNEMRPSWAGAIFMLLYKKIKPQKEFEILLDIINNRNRWHDAKECFENIRKMKNKLVNVNSLEQCFYSFAENVAKVTFNSSNETPKYDLNAGWKIALDLKKILNFIKNENDEFKKKVLEIFFKNE